MDLPRQVHRAHPRLEVLTQFLLIFGAAILYFFVRGQTEGSVEQSRDNAEAILRFEDRIGLAFEGSVQDLILDHRILTTLSNWVYIWGHWPVIGISLFVLHRIRSPHYLLLRNALFASGIIGVAMYISFPVMPPRLLDPSYRDTVTELSTSYRWLQPPALVNKYAAMPSLHAGWNLLAGIAVFRASSHISLKALGVLGPVAMSFAVVATGNHYVLDVVVGLAVASFGYFVAQLLWPLVYEAHVSIDDTRDLGNQREIVDDHSGHAAPGQFDRALEVGDAPRHDRGGEPVQSLDRVEPDQTFIDHDAVSFVPDQPAPGPNGRESPALDSPPLPTTPNGSHRSNPIRTTKRTQDPPTPSRDGERSSSTEFEQNAS